MRQLRAKDLDNRDPFTREVVARIGGDIERRSRGEALSEPLKEQVAVIKHIPLTEDLGEGYHRDTNVEKRRAVAATERHLKQQTRFKMSISRMQAFIRQYGHRGEAIFRYEWRCYKRLLQVRRHRKWRPKKCRPMNFSIGCISRTTWQRKTFLPYALEKPLVTL